MYVWKNVDILIWDKAPSPGGVRQMNRTVFQLLRDDKTMRSGVHVLTPTSGPPEGEARDEFHRFAQSHTKSVACAAVVVEHLGFMAGAIKSAVTAMLLVSGQHMNLRLFRTFDDVVKWLPRVHTERSGVAVEPAALLSLLQTTRAEHTPP